MNQVLYLSFLFHFSISTFNKDNFSYFIYFLMLLNIEY